MPIARQMVPRLLTAAALAAASLPAPSLPASSLPAGGTFSDEVPEGSDVVVRIEYGALREEGAAIWEELRPFLGIAPRIYQGGNNVERRWQRLLQDYELLTGASFARPRVVVALAFDFDAAGGMVYSAVVRGAFDGSAAGAHPPTEPGVTEVSVEGLRAWRRGPTTWTLIDRPGVEGAVLVIGNERGLQRQLRQILRGGGGRDPGALARLSRRLRQDAPVMAAFVLDEEVRTELAARFGDAGPVVKTITSGIFSARPGHIEAQLETGSATEREAVTDLVHAVAAGARGVVAILESSAELVSGLDRVGARTTLLPQQLKASTLRPLLDRWVRDFELTTNVRARTPATAEIEITLTSYRGLATAALLLLSQVDVGKSSLEGDAAGWLRILRKAEQRYKDAKGRYVACGPVPRTIPKGPVEWPKGSCFDEIGFLPNMPVNVQLEATVQGDKLVLVARSDPDGDGVPLVWYLDPVSDTLRGFGSSAEP